MKELTNPESTGRKAFRALEIMPRDMTGPSAVSSSAMRLLLVALAFAAWVTTCLDTVSYMRARETQQTVQAQEQTADQTLASHAAQTESDNEPLRQKLDKDQSAVAADQLAVASARRRGLDVTHRRQTLAADTATLQQDRKLAFQNEDFMHTAMDPHLAAIRESLQIYENSAAAAQGIESRDLRLGGGILVLWIAVFALSIRAARSREHFPSFSASHRSA